MIVALHGSPAAKPSEVVLHMGPAPSPDGKLQPSLTVRYALIPSLAEISVIAHSDEITPIKYVDVVFELTDRCDDAGHPIYQHKGEYR